MKKKGVRLCPEECPHLDNGISLIRCDMRQVELAKGKWGGVVRLDECTDEWLDRDPPPKGYIICRGDDCMSEDSGYFHGWTDIEPYDGYGDKIENPEDDFSPTHEGLCAECRKKKPLRQRELFA